MVPPEQVIGTSNRTTIECETEAGTGAALPEAEDFIDDREGKPVNIHMHIGLCPPLRLVTADGDLAMIQWTALSGAGARLAVLTTRDDAERSSSMPGFFDGPPWSRALDDADQLRLTVSA